MEFEKCTITQIRSHKSLLLCCFLKFESSVCWVEWATLVETIKLAYPTEEIHKIAV